MMMRNLAPYGALLLLLHAPASVCGAEVTAPGSAAVAGMERAWHAEYARLRTELQSVEGGLGAKREELARLRHKWLVTKGRTPTQKEIKEFEEKLAKGEAKAQENPYYNKSPLATPAPARSAYYRKLEEIRQDEARIRQLTEELAALDLRGGRAGVPTGAR